MNHPAPPDPQLIKSSIYKGQSSVLTIAINWCEHQSHQILPPLYCLRKSQRYLMSGFSKEEFRMTIFHK